LLRSGFFLEKWQEQEILVVVSDKTKETTMVEKTKFVRFAQLKNPTLDSAQIF